MESTQNQGPQVLFVALAEGLGGSMRSLATLLDHLEGFRRIVACPAPSGFTELIDEMGCSEHRVVLPPRRRGRLRARAEASLLLAHYAWRHRSEICAIHANGLSERHIVALAAALTRLPVVVWAHEANVSVWSRRLAPLLGLINNRTRFVAVSEHARQMLASSGIATFDGIEVIPNPIDPGQVLAPDSRHDPDGGCTVGYIGAAAEYKGFQLLPRVIKALRDDPVRWTVFAGPNTAMKEVWSQLKSFPESSVKLEPPVVDVREAYAALDVVYCPSLQESFGRVVAEAMMNGLPVVASNLPAIRELVDGGAGVLVPPGDAMAAAEAIRSLAASPDLRAQMGQIGRARAARYDPGIIAGHMSRLYRSA